jgi:thiol:disulfide interchange protein DsbD
VIPLLIANIVLAAAPEWTEGDPAKLIESGGRGPVLVLVHAAWCGPCNQLEFDVLATKQGRALLKRKRGVMVDFDQPVGQRVTQQYRVLSLPTLLVLDASGKETGRVEGYADADNWLQSLDKVLSGAQAMERLEARVSEAPGDLDAQLNLAKAQLANGMVDVAEKTLARLIQKKGTIGGRAARAWGRYLVRVKGDGVAGATHFAAMKRLYIGTDFRAEFLYWEAQGLALQGRLADALSIFDSWALEDPRGVAPLLYKASFMIRHRQDLAATEAVLVNILSLEDDSASAHYYLAEVKLRQGNRGASAKAIRRAMKLKPSRVIYRNFARKRLGMTFP